jgi:hypothetical protein
MWMLVISAALLPLGAEPVQTVSAPAQQERSGALSCPIDGQPESVLAGAAAEASRQLTDFPVETSADEQASFARVMAAFKACDARFSWKAANMAKAAELNLMSTLALRHMRAAFAKRGVSFQMHDDVHNQILNDVKFDFGPETFVKLANDLRRQGLKEPADEPEDISNIYLSLMMHKYSSAIAFLSP